MASLIQQRMAIDRQRVFGTISMVIGVAFIALAAVLIFTTEGARWTPCVQMVIGIAFVITGLVRRRKSAKALVKFEGEHGATAGKQ